MKKYLLIILECVIVAFVLGFLVTSCQPADEPFTQEYSPPNTYVFNSEYVESTELSLNTFRIIDKKYGVICYKTFNAVDCFTYQELGLK